MYLLNKSVTSTAKLSHKNLSPVFGFIGLPMLEHIAQIKITISVCNTPSQAVEFTENSAN
ncbi:hypothetical protein F544_1450 [Bibersteinia trehalosi USDA-ARS-USMARC-190]|uniref:Uncharacterized protein n=1 Tax=Bibersteinia trehalosi USDA-ARS-USMARC-190 TaxID=1263832 RepID=W0R3R6_BIBTR|nr:hypothetical protein F544_1450 [Bibersteinia trehalosi USDA-ARS-USMARC-190]